MGSPTSLESKGANRMASAFRCRNCNSLEPAELAGERDVPIKCPTCGAGVTWTIDAGGNPIRTENPENWIVLADLSDDELEEVTDFHGEVEVERHVPFYNVLRADGSHVRYADGTLATLPLGVEPPEGLLGPDPDHVPVMVAVEASEDDNKTVDKPGAAIARGGRS